MLESPDTTVIKTPVITLKNQAKVQQWMPPMSRSEGGQLERGALISMSITHALENKTLTEAICSEIYFPCSAVPGEKSCCAHGHRPAL